MKYKLLDIIVDPSNYIPQGVSPNPCFSVYCVLAAITAVIGIIVFVALKAIKKIKMDRAL